MRCLTTKDTVTKIRLLTRIYGQLGLRSSAEGVIARAFHRFGGAAFMLWRL